MNRRAGEGDTDQTQRRQERQSRGVSLCKQNIEQIVAGIVKVETLSINTEANKLWGAMIVHLLKGHDTNDDDDDDVEERI